MKQIYVFDLFDTLLEDRRFEFEPALKTLWEKHYKDYCTFEDMKGCEEKVLEDLMRVQSEGREVCFATDEVELYAKLLNLPTFTMDIDEEFEIVCSMGEEEYLETTDETLRELKNRGHKLYVLSNCIFRAPVLSRILDHFGALKYLDKVWSSADWGVRKPNKAFFDIAINEILEKNPGATREDIIFVGNSYKHDAIGGTGAGLTTVWLNKLGEENVDNLPVREIKVLTELL